MSAKHTLEKPNKYGTLERKSIKSLAAADSRNSQNCGQRYLSNPLGTFSCLALIP